jgi:hypothetical protein
MIDNDAKAAKAVFKHNDSLCKRAILYAKRHQVYQKMIDDRSTAGLPLLGNTSLAKERDRMGRLVFHCYDMLIL